MEILAIIPDPFDLEAWSFAATVWGGFGTLAVIPLIQLFRNRHNAGVEAKKSIHDRLEDLCERLGIIEKHMENCNVKMEKIDHKISSITTDVRVLEAISDREQDIEKEKGHNRKEDDYKENG